MHLSVCSLFTSHVLMMCCLVIVIIIKPEVSSLIKTKTNARSIPRLIHKRLCVDKNRSAVGGSDSATGVRSISFIPFTNHHTGCGLSPIGVFSARVGATSSICNSRYKYSTHAHEHGYNKHCNLLTVHQPIHCSCLPSSIPIPLYNTSFTDNLEEVICSYLKTYCTD